MAPLRHATAITALLLLLPIPAMSGLLTTIRCKEPTGTRILAGPAGSFTSAPDGFTGVKPTFILNEKTPQSLMVSFGASKIIGDLIPEAATSASIVEISRDRIVAIEKAGDPIWTYTLYPSKGVGFFTKTSLGPLDLPYIATYHSECAFTTVPE